MKRLTKRNECGQALFAKSANDYEFPIEAVAAVERLPDKSGKEKKVNHEEKTNTYRNLVVANSFGDCTTDSKYSEVQSGNSCLIARVHQMLADDEPTIRIIREIKNDKFSTKLNKSNALREIVCIKRRK